MKRLPGTICENKFIHRPGDMPKEIIVQCQACGWHIGIYGDEDHLKLEDGHKRRCKIRNAEDRRTYG